nr:DUF3558 family protein [Dietzia maris]
MAPRTSGRGNRSAARPVVQVVGKSRAFVAAVVAAGVVLSGCASADGGEDKSTTTTSPAAAEEPGNPWDLPIEQRPALFDPCAEIPIEAIEEGVGGAVHPIDEYANNERGELISCGWKSNEVHVSVLGTWKSHDEYLSDPNFVVDNRNDEIGARNAIQMTERSNRAEDSCLNLLFTGRGTVWIKVTMSTALRYFRQERSVPPCHALDEVASSIVAFVPEGDYR